MSPRLRRAAFALAILVLAGLGLSGCQRPLAGVASDRLVGDGEPATGRSPEAGGRPASGAAAAEPGGDSAPLSQFGILTPLFPGVGSKEQSAPCRPDDFYGGCL